MAKFIVTEGEPGFRVTELNRCLTSFDDAKYIHDMMRGFFKCWGGPAVIDFSGVQEITRPWAREFFVSINEEWCLMRMENAAPEIHEMIVRYHIGEVL